MAPVLGASRDKEIIVHNPILENLIYGFTRSRTTRRRIHMPAN